MVETKRTKIYGILAIAGLVAACTSPHVDLAARAPAVAVDDGEPKLHLMLQADGPTNLGMQVIDADIESWPRADRGPVLYASAAGSLDCSPNVTVSFNVTPETDVRYAVGDDVQLFIEAQCGLEGEIRSWRAVSGQLSVAETAQGYRVHISTVRMVPSAGDNQAVGTFVANGMGTGVVLHAS